MPKPPESPAVTVLMGTYNGEAFLARALEGLCAQDYDNLRVVVADDGSTDRTPAILDAWAARDPRITVRRNPQNLGWLENYRRLALGAETPYLCLAFHDDTLEPSYIRRLVERLEANPRAVVAYSDMRMLCPREDKVIRHTVQSGIASPLRRAIHVLLHRNEWWVPFRGVCRVEAARECAQELVPHRAGDASCDWLWMLRLATLGEMERVPDVLYTKYLRRSGVTLRWRYTPRRHFLRRISAARTIRAMRLPLWQKAVLNAAISLSVAQIAVDGVARRLRRPLLPTPLPEEVR